MPDVDPWPGGRAGTRHRPQISAIIRTIDLPARGARWERPRAAARESRAAAAEPRSLLSAPQLRRLRGTGR
jgi:hypothetical protein